MLLLSRKMKNNMSDYETQGAFSNKVAPDIDDFADEPKFQFDVQVVKNTFVDSKQITK